MQGVKLRVLAGEELRPRLGGEKDFCGTWQNVIAALEMDVCDSRVFGADELQVTGDGLNQGIGGQQTWAHNRCKVLFIREYCMGRGPGGQEDANKSKKNWS